jgi:hypothetical protein
MEPSMIDRLKCILLASTLIVPIFSGCASTGTAAETKSRHQAVINHLVLITLQSPSDAQALIEDCDRLLPPIESVRTWWVGVPVETGRDAVDDDYEVGLCVGFDDADGLQAYLEHPLHLELVGTWRPKVDQFRIFDVGKTSIGR